MLRHKKRRNPNSLNLLTGDIILYRENSKFSTKILLELINKITYIDRYKINIQKPVEHLVTGPLSADTERIIVPGLALLTKDLEVVEFIIQL